MIKMMAFFLQRSLKKSLANNIKYKKSVAKDLKSIDIKQSKRIIAKFEKDCALIEDIGEPLKGQFEGLFKYRVGDYRFIFQIIGSTTLVLRIGHRKDIYNKFS